MFEISDLNAGYGQVQVLHDLSLKIAEGEVVCLMGRNGAGKSTTLKSIMGLVPATSGHIAIGGAELSKLPSHQVVTHGIGYVPQGRKLFSDLTVAENIEIGLMARNRGASTREKVLRIFPRLRERMQQLAGTLSGGEQQMLAIARALCVEPRLLLLDEPTEGLQPSMVSLIRDTVLTLKQDGVATLLVEQSVDTALHVANRIAFVVNGSVVDDIDTHRLTATSPQFARYVGV